jgi:uncharacterized protein
LVRKKMAAAVILILTVLLAAWMIWETRALSVVYLEIPLEGLPVEFDGFIIVHLSDLHGRKLDPAGREVRAIREAQPDLLAVTGDFVEHRAEDVERILPFLESLAAFTPVYAVSGNHDHWTDWPSIARRLQETGVTVLENDHLRINRDEGEITLAGVSDPHTGNGDLSQALPEEIDTVVVLLAHAPTWFAPDDASTAVDPPTERSRELLKKVSLTLSGHTHGGQIKLPFLGAVSNASGRLLPRSHVEGLSREGSGWLYINRGLGTVYLPVRFLSRAEITVIILRSRN